MKKRILLSLPLACLAFAWLSGCASLQDDPFADEPATDDGVATLATSRLSDDAMTARATLKVEVDEGLAILYGTVPDEATRQRALQILEATPGVYEVLDQTRKR